VCLCEGWVGLGRGVGAAGKAEWSVAERSFPGRARRGDAGLSGGGSCRGGHDAALDATEVITVITMACGA